MALPNDVFKTIDSFATLWMSDSDSKTTRQSSCWGILSNNKSLH